MNKIINYRENSRQNSQKLAYNKSNETFKSYNKNMLIDEGHLPGAAYVQTRNPEKQKSFVIQGGRADQNVNKRGNVVENRDNFNSISKHQYIKKPRKTRGFDSQNNTHEDYNQSILVPNSSLVMPVVNLSGITPKIRKVPSRINMNRQNQRREIIQPENNFSDTVNLSTAINMNTKKSLGVEDSNKSPIISKKMSEINTKPRGNILNKEMRQKSAGSLYRHRNSLLHRDEA